MADYTTPLIQGIVSAILRDLDCVPTTSLARQQQIWIPTIGDPVRYRGESGWTVFKVERLLGDLCHYQVSN